MYCNDCNVFHNLYITFKGNSNYNIENCLRNKLNKIWRTDYIYEKNIYEDNLSGKSAQAIFSNITCTRIYKKKSLHN